VGGRPCTAAAPTTSSSGKSSRPPGGTHTRASPRHKADLYWALTGGGGSTYAVVVAMTARLHRDADDDKAPVGGASLAFNATAAPSAAAFWAAVDAALARTAPIVDADAYYAAVVSSMGGGVGGLRVSLYITAPSQSAPRVRAHLQPVVARLEQLNVAYALDVTAEPRYLDHFRRYYYGDGRETYPLPARSSARAASCRARSCKRQAPSRMHRLRRPRSRRRRRRRRRWSRRLRGAQP
jgi:hypothetical protein